MPRSNRCTSPGARSSAVLLTLALCFGAVGCSDDSGSRATGDTGGDATDVGSDRDAGDVGSDAPNPDAPPDVSDAEGDGVGEVVDEPDADEPLPDLEISGFAAIENPANSLSFFAEWETSEPSSTSLTVTCGDEIDTLIESAEAVTEHAVFVMGLLADTSCTLAASAQASDGRRATFETTYVVPQLPDWLPEVTVSVDQPELLQPGWTLVALIWPEASPHPLTPAMFDEQGRYRWYYEVSAGRRGLGNAATLVDGRVVISGSPGVPSRIVSLDGRVTWQNTFQTHHEGLFRDGIVYMLRPPSECSGDIHDTSLVVAWNVESDTERWSWHLCDHYTPPESFIDWSHSNSLDLTPDGESFVLSSRKQNALFMVDIEAGAIEWTLGYAGRPEDGFAGDFAMSEADRFQEQHSPEVLDNGNVLFFDNGSCRGCSTGELTEEWDRLWSRAVEIAVDTESWEAEVVWELRPDPDIYSRIWGDAERLANGNTLVNFSREIESYASVIIEASPAEEVVSTATLADRWGSYRASRVPELFGFVQQVDDQRQ